MGKTQIVTTTPIAGGKAWLMVAFAAVLTVYYSLPLLFLLLVLYLSYLLCGYCWTRMSCRSSAGRSSPLQEGVFTGETFSREFYFINQGPLPLVRCGMDFLLPQQFEYSSSVPVTSFLISGQEEINPALTEVYPSWHCCTLFHAWMREKDEVKLTLKLKGQLRGVYYFPPAHYYVGDPSGLFRGLNQLSREEYLFVYPRTKSMEDILDIVTFEENSRENNYGFEDRYQVQGVRDYQLKDSPKSINWYATARSGSLKTNMYQRTSSRHCLVVFDLSVGSQPSYGYDYTRLEDHLLEEAISLAAGIALFHLEQGVKTAFYTNAPLLKWEKRADSSGGSDVYLKKTRRITTLDFAKGEEQGQNILKLCAAMDETSRANSAEQEKLWEEVRKVPAGTFIYLLGYHNIPAGWRNLQNYDSKDAGSQAAGFYSPQRLQGLSSAKVRLLNLS
ncbi:MAG: DUF58 domain-containing protein [Peptococcaceae bacterium]